MLFCTLAVVVLIIWYNIKELKLKEIKNYFLKNQPELTNAETGFSTITITVSQGLKISAAAPLSASHTYLFANAISFLMLFTRI